MSVMTPDQLRQGRNLPPIQTQPGMQTQALLDQMAPQQPAAAPVATNPGTFARGGQVKQLPGAKIGETVGNIAGGVGTQLLAKQLGTNAATTAAGGAASTGLRSALTSGASGAAAGAGISLATGMLADKVRKKEEMPTFGGANGQYLDEFGRRFEDTGGGTHSNMIKYAGMASNPALVAGTLGIAPAAGAAFGAIKAAVTRHAPSAFTDFRVEDAADAIKAAYKGELGRDATDDEVMGMLVGQGWDPNGGDRWVGEKGINYLLDHIRASPESQAFKTTGVAGGQQPAPTMQDVAAAIAGESAPGAAPVAAAGAPPAVDPSGWNTDGYAAPAYVPPAAGNVPAGWDATKWNDPTHQTPKYGVGRILSNFPPTVEGLTAAFPDIQKAYPGATFDGKDKVTIPGVNNGKPIDVLEGASKGGVKWRWGTDDGSGGAGGGDAAILAALTGGGGATAAPAAGGDGSSLPGVMAAIQKLLASQGQSSQQGYTDALLREMSATA